MAHKSLHGAAGRGAPARRGLCAALAALFLFTGCAAQAPAGGTASAPAQSASAAADSAAAGSAPEHTVLTAGDLAWAVEPTYDYDDVNPVWAQDFSDMTAENGVGLVCADGTQSLFKDEGGYGSYSEMSFPQYSCLPQYYAASTGGKTLLFYMPTREDSAGLDKVGALTDDLPYLFDCSGIIWDLYPRWEAGDTSILPAPWTVMTMAERGAGSATLYYNTDEGRAHFFGGGDGPGGTDVPFADIALHKPYPVRRGVLAKDDTEEFIMPSFEGQPEQYAFAAPDGTLVTDFLYDETGAFSDGLCAACRDGKWGYLDDTGREITEFIYDAPWPYSFDYTKYPDKTYRYIGFPCTSDTMVVSRDGEMGVLYRDGSLLIGFGEFEDLAPAWNNELWAKQDGLWGLIDLADAKEKAGLPEWAVARPYDPQTDEPHLGEGSLKDLAVRPDTLLTASAWVNRTVKATPSLNMRAGTGTDYDKVELYTEGGGLPNGSTVTVVSAPKDGWVLATPDGWMFGWVKEEYLQ